MVEWRGGRGGRRGGGHGGGGGSGMRSEGAWTLNSAREAARSGGKSGGRGGRGRGRGRGGENHFGHDDRLRHVSKSDHLKHKPAPAGRGPKGKGKGKGKGKHKGRSWDDDDDAIVAPTVEQVPEEQLGRHCEVRKAHGSAVTCMAMTEQGIYTGSADKSLKRWKPKQEADGRFSLQPDVTVPLTESCCSLLHYAGWIFCGLFNGTIQAFSQDGTNMQMKGHVRRVSSIIVHQDIVISGSTDREVRLWQMDPGTKTFACTHTIKESMPGPVAKLHVLGKNLFVGGMSGIAVVDLETLAVTKLLPPTKPVADMLEFQGHVIVAYSEGSLRVFDADGTLKSETRPLAAGQMMSLAGLERGPRVLCGHSKGQVSTIVLPNFEFRTNFQALNGCKVESIHCAGHDGIFLIGSSDGTIQLWQRVGD